MRRSACRRRLAIPGATTLLLGLALGVWSQETPGKPSGPSLPTWPVEARLFGSDQDTEWSFGGDVSLSGETAIVGARFARVDGIVQGAAYVFVLEDGVWIEQAKLVASDGQEGDWFGSAVAIDDDTAVVSSREAHVDGQAAQGALYVFERSAGQWAETSKLTASDGDTLDRLGNHLALESDTILAGAPGVDDRGAAYVFVREGSGWSEQAKLFDPAGQMSDQFGRRVALDGDTALIGASDAFINGSPSQGAAYVFTRSGSSWTLTQQLLASDGADPDRFGSAVALDRDTALIGAEQKWIDGQPRHGAAYIFHRDGGTWTEVQRLVAADGQAEGNFGLGAELLGGVALIAAESDFPGSPERGVVYEFRLQGGVWEEVQKITGTIGHTWDRFGQAISLDSQRALVSNEANILVLPDGGTAWIFRRPTVFADGFESGDTGRWSQTVP